MTAVVVLTGLCLLLALPLAVTAVRQRALAAMALRNVGRRRTEAALVVGGALLGTAIITSAFVVGDVIDGAVADEARTRYGPIDLTVTTADRDTFDVATAIVRDAARDGDLGAADRGGVDGLLDVTVTTATIEAPARDTALPRVEVVALDLAEARTFGGEATDTGLASAGDLAPGEALVSAATAERLHLDTGDRLLVHVADTTTEVSVAEVVDQVGLAGYGGAIVAPGTLPDAAAAAEGRRRSATSCSCPSPVACSTPARRPATPPTPCGPRWPGCPTFASTRPRPPCSTSPNRKAPGSPSCSAPSARSA
jgi:putative ABC transport system permease protein